jgi:hypothetical protein
MKAPATSNIDVVVGLTQETNQILTPDRPFQFDETIFETAYVDIKKLFVKGLTLRVGRQNLIKNEGFLMLEGSPGDGSRTIYFNAAVLGYTWKKSKLEVMAISDPRTDRYFPRIRDRNRSIFDWGEQAIGTYYTDNNLKNTSVEAYYFFKKEAGDLRQPTHFQYQGDRRFSTAGGRVVHRMPHGWSLTGELALQKGRQRPNLDFTGRGGYTYLKKTFGGGRHYVLGGYIGMSGDNPATTGKVEGWDPLFSRWPKWSELYIYSQFREKGPSYWTNTGMWQAELGYSPIKPVNVRLTYYRMSSYYPFRAGSPLTFGTGTVRGDHPQIRVDWTPNKYMRTHVLYEHLRPGNFYSIGSPAYFLRFEAIFTYVSTVTAGGRH